MMLKQDRVRRARAGAVTEGNLAILTKDAECSVSSFFEIQQLTPPGHQELPEPQ